MGGLADVSLADCVAAAHDVDAGGEIVGGYGEAHQVEVFDGSIAAVSFDTLNA